MIRRRAIGLSVVVLRRSVSRRGGNFDGLESDGKGGYLATDYLAGKLVHISAKRGR